MLKETQFRYRIEVKEYYRQDGKVKIYNSGQKVGF